MDCRNCGAPMELFERRRYHFCNHCGAFEFIETPAIDGIQPLERRTDGFACPRCAAPLVTSLLDDQHVVHHCERCRGLLAPRSDFGATVTRRRARESGPPGAPVPIDPRELSRQVTCPACRARMDVHPYYGPGNVVIDTCSRCDLVWLDAGELKQIAEAPGRDRGRPSAAASELGEAAARTPERRRRWGSLGDALEELLDRP
jgi:Zn-finger nucleic acid-binding protein